MFSDDPGVFQIFEQSSLGDFFEFEPSVTGLWVLPRVQVLRFRA